MKTAVVRLSEAAARKPGKADDVYGWLKRQIMLSRYAPGQAVAELEVAAQMRCSQGTVREAMLRLQEDGLIVRQGYRGTVVTPLSANEGPMFLSLRAQLETQALRLSMPRLSAADIDALAALVRRMEQAAALGDEYGLFELDQQFHVALFQLADLPALVPVLIRCSLYNHRNKIALDVAPRTLEDTAHRHWALVAALKSGDVAEAERVLGHHIRSVVGDNPPSPDGTMRGAPLPRMTPALEALWRRVQAEDAGLDDVTRMPLDAARRQFDAVNARWNSGLPRAALARIERFTLPAPPRDGRAPPRSLAAVRVQPPGRRSAAAGTLLHLHGGGWVFGNNDTHLGAMVRLAERTGCAVVGIDYGLAPEHPFPHGLNDCTWAWRWLRAHSDQDTAHPWFVAGDSAGANLALSMMIDLRQAGEPLPDAALLFYGVYDADHDTASHVRCGDGSFGLSSAKMAWYRAHYLCGGGVATDPRVSPLRAALAGLPPMFISAAELDPLHDDSTALAARLAEAGVSHEFKRYLGLHHGFMQMAGFLPEADRAFDDAAAFLRARLAASNPKETP
jgi:acetyl esterase/lipase/DNA-binding GntR family transcriptional regulator